MPENPGFNIGPWNDDNQEVLARRQHEELLSALRTTEIPSNMQMEIDYVSRNDGNPVYVGYAPRGLLSNQSGWLLQRFQYTIPSGVSLSYIVNRKISYNSWDGRSSLASYS